MLLCRELWHQIFIADLRAFDALILLHSEALPKGAAALEPSALSQWLDTLPASADHAATEHLGQELLAGKHNKAVLSHIPRY